MAEIREIEVGLGLSIDKNGVWVKGNTVVKVNINSGDPIKECFNQAFDLADQALFDKMNDYLEEE